MGELKDKARQYATAFDGASPLADKENRARKAAKIRSVLADEGVFEKPNIRILDIGCSFGLILKQLTPNTGLGVGIDIDKNIGSHSDNIYFVRTDAEKLPFTDGSFDVVICNHVYEHTDDATRLLAEIERIMSADGICYFAGPNKYELIEPHYGLPFLSWLPRKLADRYMRLSGKGESYPEKPYSPSQVRRLVRSFEVTSYTEKILRDPVRYNATDILPVKSLKRLIAIFVLNIAPFFFPGFVFILRKPARSS
jgi:SAM-dependent methyltransferase